MPAFSNNVKLVILNTDEKSANEVQKRNEESFDNKRDSSLRSEIEDSAKPMTALQKCCYYSCGHSFII